MKDAAHLCCLRPWGVLGRTQAPHLSCVALGKLPSRSEPWRRALTGGWHWVEGLQLGSGRCGPQALTHGSLGDHPLHLLQGQEAQGPGLFQRPMDENVVGPKYKNKTAEFKLTKA